MKLRTSRLAHAIILLGAALQVLGARAANPIISDVFTADPAALVHNNTVYLYAGQDEAPPNSHYRMNKWLCYSSKDMKTWTAHGSPLAVGDFQWAVRDAYAGHVVEKGGKFYWFVSTEHNGSKPGKAIGVAVSDSPTGPFKDARGSAIVTADMTTRGGHGWEDIDPAIFTDADGASYLFWGNAHCYYARLKPNMTELDGPIRPVAVPFYTEAPWVHKRGSLYYLSYASGFPEKMAYATASKITGPWTYRGLLSEVAGNSNTIHQAIIEFKGQSYFIYHNGALTGGDSYRRAVCVDHLYYNADGTIRRVAQTSEGTSLPPLPPRTPDRTPLPSWNRLQSFSDPGLFVRHANYKGALSAFPFDPYQDTMWKVLPGLSDAKGISFESLSFPGHFLRHQEGEVILAKDDGTPVFEASATFLREPGLADASWSSFRVGDAPGKYLRRSQNSLRIEPISSLAARRDATFRLTYEGAVPLGQAPRDRIRR